MKRACPAHVEKYSACYCPFQSANIAKRFLDFALMPLNFLSLTNYVDEMPEHVGHDGEMIPENVGHDGEVIPENVGHDGEVIPGKVGYDGGVRRNNGGI